MDIVKLPKKFRDVCERIMEGDESALSELDNFVKYPHQVAAVKAEVAYFNGDWKKGFEYDMEILPYFNDWYYANVGNEHRAALVVAALKLGLEKELTKKFNETAKFLKEVDADRQQPIKNISIMKTFLKKKIWPFSDCEDSYYQIPENPVSLDQIKDKLKTLVKKKDLATSYGRLRLFYLTYQEGFPKDAVETFENINDESKAENAYIDAIKLYHFLGNRFKTIEIIEKLAASRLWYVAASTQVRPMEFFSEPVIVEYMMDPEVLAKIKKASEDGMENVSTH